MQTPAELLSELSPVLADRALGHALPSVAFARGRKDIGRQSTAMLLARGYNNAVVSFPFSPHALRRTQTATLVGFRTGQRVLDMARVRLVRPVKYAVRLKTKTKIQSGSLYDVIRHVWKTQPHLSSEREDRESKFKEVLDSLVEGGDTEGISVLADVAAFTWSEARITARRDGVLTRTPANTWPSVFSTVQDMDHTTPRDPNKTYLRPDSNIFLDGSPETAAIWIPRMDIIIRDDKIQFTILDGTVNNMFEPGWYNMYRPLTLFPDGSAISHPSTHEMFRVVLDGLERGDPSVRDALAAGFDNPRTLRRPPGVTPVDQLAAAGAVPGTVPESVIRASPVLQNMVDDLNLTPAQLFDRLPIDAVAADACLSDMAAWLEQPQQRLRFMPVRAAQVANLAHFLGIDCMCDWIVERVGFLLSLNN